MEPIKVLISNLCLLAGADSARDQTLATAVLGLVGIAIAIKFLGGEDFQNSCSRLWGQLVSLLRWIASAPDNWLKGLEYNFAGGLAAGLFCAFGVMTTLQLLVLLPIIGYGIWSAPGAGQSMYALVLGFVVLALIRLTVLPIKAARRFLAGELARDERTAC